jgi:hypothetical protein
MADETQLIYLEPDDEITTVVRRLREADAHRLVLVASGRTKATTSAVALRLLAQVAAEEGREVVLVADAAARALAAEAGIAAFGTVAEASVEGAVPAPAPPPAAAPIHVVRGEEAAATVDEPPIALPPAATAPTRGMDETQAVRIPPPTPAPARPRPGPHNRRPTPSAAGFPLAVLIGLLALLVAAGAAAATVLPAASITIRRQPIAVGPLPYNVTPEVHASDASDLTSAASGEATGHRTRRTAATGTVLLINYSPDDVLVPAGTLVSAGREILFRTTKDVTVPESFFAFVGTAEATIEAVEPGPSGNVDADAIDRIEDKDIDRALRGPGPDERRIRNDDPTEGGDERELLVVSRRDVERVKEEITTDLQAQFEDASAAQEDRIYAGDPPKLRINVPDDLVGNVSQDPFTFNLTGRLMDERPYLLRQDAEAAALDQLLADPSAAGAGATVDESSVQFKLGEATQEADVITVPVTVTAIALRNVDEEAVRSELAGKTVAEAEAALEPIGPPTVTLWPFWVDRVPRIDWRISIDVQAAEPPS